MPIFLLAVPRNILKCRFLYSTQSLNFNNDAILLGIILCVIRQVYLDVVMPDTNEVFMLLRSYIKEEVLIEMFLGFQV